MDRKRLINLLSLNSGIATACIIFFSPGLVGIVIGGSALETALGITLIFVSGVGLTYGNYKLLTVPDEVIPPIKMTMEDYIETLNIHKRLKTFEVTVDLLLDQIERLPADDRRQSAGRNGDRACDQK